MLIVTIETVQRGYSESRKANLIHRITEAAVEVEGEAMRKNIIVKMNEVSPDAWAVGGNRIGRGERDRPVERSIEHRTADAEKPSS